MQIGIIIDHKEALSVYQAAGHSYPTIPANSNTYHAHFTTADGNPALIVNQRGFAPTASDNEEQVNGCSVAIAIDPPDPDTARATLNQWLHQILQH